MKWGFSLMLLVCLCAESRGKPISFVVDQELKTAWSVFEATATVKGQRIALIVTSDVDRIYRGHARLGQRLTLQFWGAGRHAGQRFIQTLGGKPVLLVIDKQKQIRLVATRAKLGYRFRGFYDYNAVWLRTRQKGFGRLIKKDSWGLGDPLEVTFGRMKKTFAAEQFQSYRRAAVLLLKSAEARSMTQLERLLTQLGSRRFARREQAQVRLIELAVFHRARLVRESKSHADLEVRRRLRLVLQDIALWDQAKVLADRAAGEAALKQRILKAYRLGQK